MPTVLNTALCVCLQLGSLAAPGSPGALDSLTPTAPAFHETSAPPREDGWRHLLSSFVVTSMAGSGARLAGLSPAESMRLGAAAGATAGLLKELRDLRHPSGEASIYDLAWDAAGVAAAAGLLSQVR